jgi:exopolyphosphatase / guanosine-5'-triphosphate,3'-diphosphate pyrophosphatase
LVRSDPMKPKHWKEMKDAIDRGIRSIVRQPAHRAELMIGSGGTFTSLAHMSKFQREGRHGSVQGYVLTPAEIIYLLRRLRETPLEARRQIPGLSADRADIIIAGAAVISRLVRGLDTQQIMVNERGIRDGLLLNMIAELPGRRPESQPGNRIEWARHFARKAHSNEPHFTHVADLALQIFDGVKARFDLPAASRELLQAAAILHDVGYLISHSKNHKHAYHLIMHGDLPGFTPHEVELIANVVRYHRRVFPKKRHENLAYLTGSDRRLIGKLSGILRIADGLDRTHSQTVAGLKVRALRGRLRISVEAKSLPEIELADAARKADLFRKAFHTDIELAWHPVRAHTNGAGRAPRLHIVAS